MMRVLSKQTAVWSFMNKRTGGMIDGGNTAFTCSPNVTYSKKTIHKILPFTKAS